MEKAEDFYFEDLDCVLQKLLAAGRSPLEIFGSVVSASFSIGISLRREAHADASSFIADADLAAYRAKAAGGNRAQLFEPSFRKENRSDRTLQQQMVEALETDQFLLQYQPMIDCQTGRLVAVEALVRWQQPDGTLLHPGSFIPLAEKSSLIVRLGHALLQKALAQQTLWAHRKGRTVPLSVNVSAREIMSDGYMAKLQEVLSSVRFEPGSLILELTETALVGLEQQRTLLPAIRDLGVRLAMDDFGIGYSNIGYLKNFPVDIIKIDRSFVSGIPNRPREVALITAMLAMAKSVQAVSTAEGVETATQALFLKEAGCTLVQGNFFSRPVCATTIEDMLQQTWNFDVELVS